MKKSDVLKLTDKELDKVVKIAGTKFDRRRKLQDADIAKIVKAYEKGTSITELAEKYGVSYTAIKYHVDENYKSYVNSSRWLYGTTTTFAALNRRADYKRSLVAENKFKVTNI